MVWTKVSPRSRALGMATKCGWNTSSGYWRTTRSRRHVSRNSPTDVVNRPASTPHGAGKSPRVTTRTTLPLMSTIFTKRCWSLSICMTRRTLATLPRLAALIDSTACATVGGPAQTAGTASRRWVLPTTAEAPPRSAVLILLRLLLQMPRTPTATFTRPPPNVEITSAPAMVTACVRAV